MVSVRVSPEFPELVSPGETTVHHVYAVDAQGIETDVTSAVQVESDTSGRVMSSLSGNGLTLTYSPKLGPLTVTLQVGGIAVPKSVWVSTVAKQAVSKLILAIGDGFSPMAKVYGSDHFVSIAGRNLLLNVSAWWPNQQTSIEREVQVESSDPDVIDVHPQTDPSGNVPWFIARVLRPGTVNITARLGSYSVTQQIVVQPALVIEAGNATAVGITENAAGRVTSYVLGSVQSSDLGGRRVYFSTSEADNQWHTPVGLVPPSDGINIPGDVKAAESANGYRAVVTVSMAGRAWAHLIGADGTVRGPVDLASDLGQMSAVSHVFVDTNGGAHVWLFKPGEGLRRLHVDAVSLTPSLVNLVAMPGAAVSRLVAVGTSASGTIGIAWSVDNCTFHFAIDALDNRAALTSASTGDVVFPSCNPAYAGAGGFSVGAGPLGISIASRFATSFTESAVWLANISLSRSIDQHQLDVDRGIAWATAPRMGVDGTGALMVLWQTSDRGVWAAYQNTQHSLTSALQVEPPFMTLATPDVANVYPRGDGRFLLAWTGGQAATRNRLEFRDYSPTDGLSDLQSMPFEVFSATNMTHLNVSLHGISVAWSYFTDVGTEVFSAVQSFLP
jgi:hypothetical protein